MAPVRCFLFDSGLGRNITPSDAVEMSCAEILAEWDSLSCEPGSFLGLCCQDWPVLQFMWEEDGQVIIDVPLPKMGGSLTKKSEAEEPRTIIVDVFSGKNPQAIPGLRFVSWT